MCAVATAFSTRLPQSRLEIGPSMRPANRLQGMLIQDGYHVLEGTPSAGQSHLLVITPSNSAQHSSMVAASMLLGLMLALRPPLTSIAPNCSASRLRKRTMTIDGMWVAAGPLGVDPTLVSSAAISLSGQRSPQTGRLTRLQPGRERQVTATKLRGMTRPLWKDFHKGRYHQFDGTETCRSTAVNAVRRLSATPLPLSRPKLAGSLMIGKPTSTLQRSSGKSG